MTQGHDDNGRRVETTEFDYDAVERALTIEPESDLTDLQPEDLDKAIKGLRVILQWMWQSGMKNAEGVKIRGIICCWIFLKELRSLSMTDMANGYGMDKQSLGRWVDDFKLRFPKLRISHMR